MLAGRKEVVKTCYYADGVAVSSAGVPAGILRSQIQPQAALTGGPLNPHFLI